MRRIVQAILVVIILMNLVSCKKNSAIVEPEPNYEPGRRDYVWTADTIKAYYIYFNSLWGKSVDNVWAVSMVGGTHENIYRYNGTTWYKETSVAVPNTVSLWGTDDNLWISTHDGHIWNYNSGIFTSSPEFLYEGTDIDFFSIAGKNNNEIYACGGKNMPMNRDGIIYKYNGVGWQLDRILKNYGNIYWVKYSSRNDKYYFLTYLGNQLQQDTTRLIEYDGKDITTLLYQKPGENFIINDIDGYLYVTEGNKIYRYYDGRFNDYLVINYPNFGSQVWGRNKSDLLIQMKDGLLHYNGTDLKYILKFPNNTEYGSCALVLAKDVFVHAFDNKSGYNIIYHGELK